jgi:(1->4)-alpha-D-glucan 1-alpha-D-glucosylmutase
VAALAERLMASPEDGLVKMFVTSRALAFRRANKDLFDRGDYEGLAITGARSEHVVGFSRTHENRAAAAVVGRHFARLGSAPWDDTKVILPEQLAGRRWREVLTDRVFGADNGAARAIPASEIFAHLPVALLEPHE